MSLEHPLVAFFMFTIVCAFVGWITNVLAVKMIFWPYEPIRIAGLNFQGVLPKHQRHFAGELAGIIVRDFMTTADMVGHLDPARLTASLRELFEQHFDRVVAELRAALPDRQMFGREAEAAARAAIFREVEARLPELLAGWRARANSVVDLREIVGDRLFLMGPKRLEEIIYSVSKRELDWIEWYGGIFGFVLGAIQFGFAAFVEMRWSLVLGGAIVGTVTNWLAIWMLFNPRDPKRLLGVEFQGLFPKGQKEIAAKMGRIAADDLIVPVEIFAALLDRMIPKELSDAVLAEMEEDLAKRYPGFFQMAQAMLGEDGIAAVQARLAGVWARLRREGVAGIARRASAEIDIDRLLREKVVALSRSTFERLLRGLFAKEEIYLIIYGTILGALIGLIQLAIVAFVG